MDLALRLPGKSKLTHWDSRDLTANTPLRFLEEALGVVGQKIKKPEYNQRSTRTNQQRIGGQRVLELRFETPGLQLLTHRHPVARA
jgi:hypothetical protein